MVSFLPLCLVQDVGILDLASGSDASGAKGVRCAVHKHPDSKSQATDLRKEGSRGELRSERLAPASFLPCRLCTEQFSEWLWRPVCGGEGALLVLAGASKQRARVRKGSQACLEPRPASCREIKRTAPKRTDNW